jgi:hypothetical protein
MKIDDLSKGKGPRRRQELEDAARAVADLETQLQRAETLRSQRQLEAGKAQLQLESVAYVDPGAVAQIQIAKAAADQIMESLDGELAQVNASLVPARRRLVELVEAHCRKGAQRAAAVRQQADLQEEISKIDRWFAE